MPKRVDANQREIVEALRGIGATVQHLHEVGKGCPDILVGYRGNNWLFEIKSKAGKMTPDEITWHNEWRGRVLTIRSHRTAIDYLTGYSCPADVPPF
jgi:hypothetical protein